MGDHDFDARYYGPPSKPRKAKGGIKAHAQRGAFGTRWWAKRWIAVLESFHIGSRLQRGRAYARAGQVLDIAISPGLVTAKVQGSRRTPYAVSIRISALKPEAWRHVLERICAEARFAARLLRGEMPEDIEEAFAQARVALFPASLKELQTDCSCPDWSNPCKHVAAVYYLIGEEFDRDPFLLFALRGLARDALMTLIRGPEPQPVTTARAAKVAKSRKAAKTARSAENAPPDAARQDALPPDAQTFWGENATALAAAPEVPAARPPIDGWLLKRAGNFPFWRGNARLGEALVPVYEAAAERALLALAGEPMHD